MARIKVPNSDKYSDNPKTTKSTQRSLPNKRNEPSSSYSQKRTSDTNNDECFIATACYGSLTAPQVNFFRRYRDSILDKTISGRGFIRLYYSISPSIARLIRANRTMRLYCRVVLDVISIVLHRKYNI